MSYVLVNFQEYTEIKEQTDGHSSQFHNGTVYFAKRDQCFVYPTGTIISSPTNLRFCIYRCQQLTLCMSKVYGNIINDKDTITPQQKNDCEDDLYLE